MEVQKSLAVATMKWEFVALSFSRTIGIQIGKKKRVNNNLCLQQMEFPPVYWKTLMIAWRPMKEHILE